jgi:hypothetical protein
LNSKRLYFVFVGIIVVLIGLTIGGAVMADKVFQSKSDELVKQKAESQALSTKQQQLIADKRDIKTYAELSKIARTIVPQDKDQALAVREIAKLAHESGIPRLSSVSFPTSTLGTTASGTPTSSANRLTQLTPVKGISGVYDLQITIQQVQEDSVSYNTFITFLEKLEQNRRTAQVSNIIITPGDKNPDQIAFTLTIDEFIKP